MEEHQVTVENETRALPRPFFVIATQNPIDQLGTYPLPESQLDRFLMCITLGYPDRASERALLAGEDRRGAIERLTAGDDARVAARRRKRAVHAVHASDALLDYLQALIAATRSGQWFTEGLSPRAGIAWLRAARARALMGRRDYVAPDDLQAVAAADHRASAAAGGRRRPRPRRAGARDGGGRGAALSAAVEALRSRRPMRIRRRAIARLVSGQTACRSATRTTLTQGNIYILPTKAGFAFALTLGADAAGVDQLPAQPRLPADLPAGRQRAGVDARDARHAARPHAAR